MHALEVSINGKRLCVASAGEDGLVISNVVLTGAVSGPPGAFAGRFRVGGILNEQHLEWAIGPIKLGDVVEIRIVDSLQPDPPASVEPVTDAQRERLRAATEEAES